MAIEQLYTVAEYDDYVRRLPPEAPNTELINGRLVVAARPVRRHARYQRELLGAINTYIREHQLPGEVLPEFEVLMDEHTLLIPDLAYIIEDSPLGRMTEERLYGAPEWACEIASPSTRANDEQEKYLAYLRAGVREYWQVDPDRPAGQRFQLYERVEEGTISGKPTYRPFDGGPAASCLFPGIIIDANLL